MPIGTCTEAYFTRSDFLNQQDTMHETHFATHFGLILLPCTIRKESTIPLSFLDAHRKKLAWSTKYSEICSSWKGCNDGARGGKFVMSTFNIRCSYMIGPSLRVRSRRWRSLSRLQWSILIWHWPCWMIAWRFACDEYRRQEKTTIQCHYRLMVVSGSCSEPEAWLAIVA